MSARLTCCVLETAITVDGADPNELDTRGIDFTGARSDQLVHFMRLDSDDSRAINTARGPERA